MPSVAVITTVIIVWCCVGMPEDIAAKIMCETCGGECKEVCGTKQFKPCCFNYLKKRKIDSEPTELKNNAICRQCGEQCSYFCATKLFALCCSQYQVKQKDCKACGRECSQACGTKNFRSCCLNYHKKRSVSNPLDGFSDSSVPLPLALFMVVPDAEDFNDEVAVGTSSPSVQMYYDDLKTEQEDEK